MEGERMPEPKPEPQVAERSGRHGLVWREVGMGPDEPTAVCLCGEWRWFPAARRAARKDWRVHVRLSAVQDTHGIWRGA